MQCIYLLKQFVYKYLSRFLQNTNENYNKKIKESVALHKGRIMITKKITKKSIIVISLSWKPFERFTVEKLDGRQ